MKKLVFCFIMILIAITSINSQVVSRQLGKEEVIDSFLAFHKIGNPILHLQPKLDVEKVLNEDIQSGRYLDRFAIPYETNYQVKDGKWYIYDNKLIWRIGFNAPHAASLQFMFEHLKLPADSEMFVYSTASKMIQGPITMESVTNGIFTTDVIERTGLVFIAVVFNNRADDFTLKITKISQGIKKIETRAWGDARNCNFDINCSIGSPWAFQRDAVGLTVNGMSTNCSGTLINTSCRDFKPYFLTAQHCTSGSDQNPANTVFRFNYQSSDPACPGKTKGTEPPASTWITRSGATTVYTNFENKVSLLLLNGGRIGINQNESNLKMAGWDKDVTLPTSGAVIHHPKFDAKKISIPSSIATNGPNNQGQMFQVHFSQGIIEGGSSGSPLFNQHGRIVGVTEQFPAGSDEHNCSNNSTVFVLITRLSQVWANALGPYLDPTNQVMSIDGMSLPIINNNGSDVVCTTDKQFNITNLMAGKTITWSVSPANLFAVSNGTGTIATLRSATSNSQGSAILSFNLSQSGCDNIVITRKIWVGKPLLPNTNPIGSPPIEIGIGQLQNISLVGHSYNSGAFPFTGTWSGSGSVSSISSSPTPGGTFIGNYQGSGNFSVVTSNNCGDSQIKWGAFNVSGPCNPCPRIIINNPVSNNLICEIPEDRLPIEVRSQLDNINGDFQLLDQNGTILINEKFKTNIHSRDVSEFNSGIYFVNMKFNETQLIEKVIIIK